MALFDKHELHLPLWLVYSLTFLFGMIFSGMIVFVSWDQAIDTKKNEFSLKSIPLKNTVFSNTKVAHNTVDSLASFFDSHPMFSQDEFEIVTTPVLKQHSYIDGIFYAKLELDKNASSESVILDRHLTFNELKEMREDTYKFIISQQNFRQQTIFTEGEDIFANQFFHDIIKTVLSTHDAAAIVIEQEGAANKYLLLKALRSSMIIGLADDNKQLLGLIGMVVDPIDLLGTGSKQFNTSLTMVNDLYNLGGRKRLHHTIPEADVSAELIAANFIERGVTQFPIYSISVTINRDIKWSEVEKGSIYISLLIGIGITLLLIALVRAKDLQAQELRERNLVIERQVDEQTKELALARDEAIEASRIKSDFLASMSHEIRTPLNAIIGMSTLLEESKLTSEQSKYVEVFKKAGDTLLTLVNDILDLSKIEAQQLELEEIEFDITSVVEEAIDIYALKAEEKGVELLSLVTTDIKRKREGDPARLKQIILNLISNALKFTEQGEIIVYVSHNTDYDDENELKFSVSDTGIGIPADKCDSIFSSFSQVDSSVTRKYGGTGLGLAICRSLVEMMQGKIQVESEEGKGSVFTFTVRLPALASDDERGDSFANFTGNKALIAHNNTTSINILSDYLASYSIETVAINSGAELKEKLQTGSVSKDFDIIMLNSHLADGELFSFLEQTDITDIRSKTILMLHAAELNHHIDAVQNLGVASYLVKPIKQLEMLQHVSNILLGKTKTTQLAAKQEEIIDKNKPLDILLVEDNPDNRLLFKAYLKRYPYTIEEAENGEIAVEMFKQKVYDVVFMDIQMPVMDGHTATRHMRQWEGDENKSPTPIIALTAHAIKEEIDKCMAAGCNSHLSKPVKKSVLIETIQNYL